MVLVWLYALMSEIESVIDSNLNADSEWMHK